MINQVSLRNMTVDDEDFIWLMLMYASHEETVNDVKNNINLARYAKDWDRVGDIGFIAIDQDLPVGAAWIRVWSETDKGFGFIRSEVPELVVATIPEYRGNGIGTLLITTLLNDIKSTYPEVSLSVRQNNPAIKLYEKLGFAEVVGSKIINRTGGVSFIMSKSLISDN